MSHTEQMGKKRRILLVFLLVAVIGAVIWKRMQPREPIYMGKPLSYWLEAFNPGIGSGKDAVRPRSDPPTVARASEALHQIGSNGLSTLLRMMQRPNPSILERFVAQAQKQSIIEIPFQPANLNESAFFGLLMLGSEASNAVPQLIEIFEKNHASFPQTAAPAILGRIGPASEPAIPTLLRAISNTNRVVRCNVIFALGRIHAQPKLVVPVLAKCLNDPDLSVRVSAVQALGAFGHDAQMAVPALLELRRKAAPIPSGTSRLAWPAYALSSSSVEMFSGPFLSVAGGPMGPDMVESTTETLKQIDPEAATGNLFEKWYGSPSRDEKHPVETLH
jgi:hypothetical protein